MENIGTGINQNELMQQNSILTDSRTAGSTSATVQKGTATVPKDTATGMTSPEAADSLHRNTATDDIADKALKAAGVADNAHNRELTEILIECGRALSEANIRQLIRQTAAFPDADPRLICRLNESGTAVNEYSLARAAEVDNRTAELLYSTQDVMNELELLLEGDAPGGEAGAAFDGFLGEISAAIEETLNSRNQMVVNNEAQVTSNMTGPTKENGTTFNTLNGEQNTNILESTVVDKTQNEPFAKQYDTISNHNVEKVEIVISNEEAATVVRDPLEGSETVKQPISAGVAGDLRQDVAAPQPGEALQGAEEGYVQEALQGAGEGYVQEALQGAGEGYVQETLQSAGEGYLPETVQRGDSHDMPADFTATGSATSVMTLPGRTEGTYTVPVQSLLSELKRVCSLRPGEVSQKELGRLHRRLTELMKRLEEITSEAVKKGEAPEGVAEKLHDKAGKALKDLGLMRELSDSMSYVEIPLRLKDSTTDATLYVYTDARRRRPDPDDCSALLHLKMPHLGAVDVRAVLKRDTLRLEFSSEGQSLELLERDISSLSETLTRKGYSVNTDFRERLSDEDGQGARTAAETAGRSEGADKGHGAGRRISKQGFDARA